MKVEVVNKSEYIVAEIEAKSKLLSFSRVMKKAFHEIITLVRKNELTMAAAPYCRYLNAADIKKSKGFLGKIKEYIEDWNLKIGVPVTTKFQGTGRIKCEIYPAGRYAQTVHIGPYSKLGDVHWQLLDWLKEHNFSYLGESVEIYISDPSKTKPEDLQTLVLVKF